MATPVYNQGNPPLAIHSVGKFPEHRLKEVGKRALEEKAFVKYDLRCIERTTILIHVAKKSICIIKS